MHTVSSIYAITSASNPNIAPHNEEVGTLLCIAADELLLAAADDW